MSSSTRKAPIPSRRIDAAAVLTIRWWLAALSDFDAPICRLLRELLDDQDDT